MNREILQEYKIFETIKSDDLKNFSLLLTDENKNISFGRFPILSLCFLYNSKKIIKSYENILSGLQTYRFVEEPFEVYKKFQSVAKRSARLYLKNNSIVLPLEMLAILGCDKKVKKVFINYFKNENTISNLEKIYKQIKGQQFEENSNKLKIGAKRISRAEKKKLCSLSIFATISIVLLCGIFGIVDSCIGTGIVGGYKISSQKQLFDALESNSSIILKNDIYVDNPYEGEFVGQFDGKGKTIFASGNLANQYLFRCNKGVLKNLNIVYQLEESELIFKDEKSLLCYENSGNIENVNVVFKSNSQFSLIKEKSELVNTCLVGFAVKNDGKISNCSVDMNLSALNESKETNASICGFVSENNGTIENCRCRENSKIETQNIDICGFAVTNGIDAEILDCTNNANFLQAHKLEGWSPNVAGLVMQNYGLIRNCRNNGELNIVSSDEQETENNVFIGGISTINLGKIEHSKNESKIKVDALELSVYAGGICAVGTYDYEKEICSEIVNCGSQSDFSISNSDSASSYVGGIIGYANALPARNLVCKLTDCFSASTFEDVGDSTKNNFVGLVVGIARFNGLRDLYLWVDAVYVLTLENLTNHIGLIASTTSFVTDVKNVQGVTNTATMEELQETNVYFDSEVYFE